MVADAATCVRGFQGLQLGGGRERFRDNEEWLREDRSRRGLWTPLGPPPPGTRPGIQVERMSVPPVPRREQTKWMDLEVLIEGVVAAYRLATARGERTLTQPVHRELAKEYPGVVPAPSVVDRNAKRHGKTAAWVRTEATRRRRARRRR